MATELKMAVASSEERVWAVPAPPRTPPELEEPGRMKIRLEPSPRIWLETAFWEPWPTAMRAMTAPTPMTMPSVDDVPPTS